MKIILLNTVKGLGEPGAIVTVADGYARNYLLPRKLALMADESNVRQHEHQRRMIAQVQQREVTAAQALSARIAEVTLQLEAAAGEAGRLHGTITAADVAETLAREHGIEVDRHAISFAEPIKVVGSHEAKIRLSRQVEATVKLEVSAPTESAE